ncbi:MAG TPA: hypothetical protein VFM63_11445 [Pyrinomonadaceae bacterium]|nr:hypothetical protein [Pyrinomonadaceae bacterium]
MSKNKDLEKKLEKEIEKAIKPEKEFEKRKELKQEIKETKEFKEFKDKIEIKERIKDFKEIKEFKEFEKRIPDKGPKEIVEGGGIDPGILFRAEKPEEGMAAAPKPEPELKQKEIEKIKPEKEFPDKIQKEIEKIKPEKEFEKFQKELEKIKPEKEYPEKFQVKPEFEKLSIETKLDPGTRLFKGSGTPEDRLRELEDAVEKLTHFIGVDLRPDLTTGALKGEPDVSGGEAKPDDKKKPK